MKQFLCLILISSLFLASCGDDEVIAPTTGTIKGKVLDGATNQGLFGVSILTDPPTSAVITNTDGTFSLLNVNPGAYTITASKTGYITKSITVSVSAGDETKADFLLFNTPANGAPVFSPTVSPKNNDTSQATDISFFWSAIDPDGDIITYNFYIGKSAQALELKGENISNTTFQMNSLEKGAKYYWRVTAKDSKGNMTESGIWSFTTKNMIASAGLSSYYTFSGNANDASGNGFNGQVSGAILTTDRFGQSNAAYQFDGKDDYIVVPNSSTSLLEPTSEITLSCFIYADNSSGSNAFARIIRKSAPLKGGYHLSWDHNYNHRVGAILNFETSGTLQGEELAVPNVNYVGKWHHVVFTFSKATNTGKLYIDGELVTSNSDLNYPLHHSDSNLFIGGTTGQGVNQTFPGKIDDVRIYNRVLFESEINEIYHEGGFGM